MHSVVTGRAGDEGEAKVRGTAVPVTDRARRAEVCRAIGSALPFEPDPDRVDLFRIDVTSVALVRYVDGDQHVAVWPEGRRYVRRLTSDTSVGDPEDERPL